MREVLIGQTDYSVLVKIIGTDGAPETGLAHTDIDIAYSRVETDNDVTTADVAPADLANLTAAHSDWGWEEVSSTDHPGLYRLDIADAVFASGAWEAVVTITDASGTDFYAHDIGFRLVSFNVQDGVRLGLTALPNAAADAAGGLPISDAGGLDLDAKLANTNEITAARMGALTDWINGGRLDLIIDAILEDTGTTLQAELDGIQADTEDIQTRIPAALVGGRIDANMGAISSDATAADNAEAFFDGTGYAGTNNVIPLVTTTTTATNVTTVSAGGISAASFAAGAIDAAAMNVTGSELTAIPWNAAWDAEVQSEVQDAIEANHLDHLLATAADGTECVNSTYWARLVSKSATPAFSSFVNTTDSLEALRDRGDAAWTTATGFSTHSAADVWAVGTRVLTAGTNIVLPANGLSSVTAWTVDITGSLSGSVGSISTAITLPTIPTAWITADGIATDAFGALEVAAGAASEIATAVRTELGTELGRIDVAISTRGTGAALDAAGVRTAVGLASANLDTQLALRTGYKLAADGLDLITATVPSGVATTFPQMVVQNWWRNGPGKTVYDSVAQTITLYAANGTSVIYVQTATSAAGVQAVGVAS